METTLKRLGIAEDGFGYLDSKGCYWKTLKDAIWGGVLGFCCCGEPERGLKRLRSILETVELCFDNDADPYYFEDDTVFYFYVLDKMELTQHGSCVYHSWLSEKGKDILTVLKNIKL
jgi:hypothetical protein